MLQTSPNPKIFLYTLCYKVSYDTFNKLFDFSQAKLASTKFSWLLVGIIV